MEINFQLSAWMACSELTCRCSMHDAISDKYDSERLERSLILVYQTHTYFLFDADVETITLSVGVVRASIFVGSALAFAIGAARVSP